MRINVRSLVEKLDKALSFEGPIYEFGSYQVKGQEDRAVRTIFAGRDFVGCDMREGPGVDLQLNLEKLNLPDDSVQTVICLDTLEHVKKFWLAGEEIYRVLKPGGVAIIVSTMYFPVHSFPSDYWRFTPEGFRIMTESFDDVLVEWAGPEAIPHTVAALAFKGKIDDKQRDLYLKTLADWKSKNANGWREWALLAIPPFMLGFCYKVFGKLTGT